MKRSIKNISSVTLFGGIILIAITTIFIVACLLMPSKDVDAAGANMNTNPAPIEKSDSAKSNISLVPNTKWGEHYTGYFDLVYDKNTNLVMYQSYTYRRYPNIQPMLGPNGYPCRLEGHRIVETQTNQFVMSTE